MNHRRKPRAWQRADVLIDVVTIAGLGLLSLALGILWLLGL